MLSTRSATFIARTGIRNYAASAAATTAGNAVKVPVALFGVDGTYASALYTASAKSSSVESPDKALESTEKALRSLKSLFARDPKLATIIASPTLQADERRVVVSEILKASGQDKTIRNLLEVLADNNRLGLVRGIIEKYEVLMGAHRGLVEAVVTSAEPLDNKTRSKLDAAISKSQFVGQGKKSKTSYKVDSKIMGGLIVEVGDRTIDLSVSSKMSKLNKMLTDTL